MKNWIITKNATYKAVPVDAENWILPYTKGLFWVKLQGSKLDVYSISSKVKEV